MLILLGLMLIGTGVFLAYYMEGKAFARRNSAGVEVFDSYSHSLKIKFKEGAIKVGAGIVLLIGICTFVSGFFV